MIFLYPLGLLGLLGIPILILIYIIKNKYTEQTVPSTYIWSYSERFLKRRKKLPLVAGLISLILQLLTVLLVSFAIAHPVFIFPGTAAEHCFIIDASGSMRIEEDGVTRFERGKQRIAELIEESAGGSVYTLISVNDNATNVVFERLDDKKKALERLAEIAPSHGVSDLSDALLAAQAYFEENSGLRTYLVTDKDYGAHANVELLQVAADAVNHALSDVQYSFNEQQGVLRAAVTATSFGADAELHVQLFLDGAEAPVATEAVSLSDGEGARVSFEIEAAGFTRFTLCIAEQDALEDDNVLTVYNPGGGSNAKTALLVGETLFFWRSAMESAGVTVTVMTPEAYENALRGGEVPATGYGLYLFDSYTPPAMPEDGSVWLINQKAGLDGSGFSVQGEVLQDEAIVLEATTSSASLARRLLADTVGDTIHVYKYVKYGVYGSFTTLYSYNRQPLVFAGRNEYGNCEVVLAFSLHDSNLSMRADFIMLMRNLLAYSYPDVLGQVSYVCGETPDINVPANCTGITVMTPSGEAVYPISGMAARELILNEPGTYTITLAVGETERRYHVFCAMPIEESAVRTDEAEFSLQGEAGEGGLDGRYDDLIPWMIALAVIVIADWMVYCYDRRQLR